MDEGSVFRSVLENLETLHNKAVTECRQSVDWYQDRKKWKKVASFWLRLAAVLFTGVAGLLPAIVSLDLLGGTIPTIFS